MSKRWPMSLATLAALLCLVVSTVGATPEAAAAPGMKVLARGSGNGTALLVGGTGQPSGQEMVRSIGMRQVPPGAKVVAIQTPAQFAPVYGTQSYDDSKRDGARRIVRAIKQTSGQKTLVVYSQSTVSADIALRQLRREGYNMNSLTVVKVANARRNGPTKGIETVFPTFRAPGITSGGAEARTGVRTIDHCLQYDPVCDAPRAGSPLSSYINAVMCYFECHSNYGSAAMRRRPTVVEQRGNTTYVTYRQKAPLTKKTGIYVPDSLAGKRSSHPAAAPVQARRQAVAVAPAPAPAPVRPYVPAPVPAPMPVHIPAYVPPPAPVVTQQQVRQVTQQVVRAVPQAAPVVRQITSHPAVRNFLKGLPR